MKIHTAAKLKNIVAYIDISTILHLNHALCDKKCLCDNSFQEKRTCLRQQQIHTR